MADLSTGLVPGDLKPSFQPDTTPYIAPSSLPQIAMPDYSQAINGVGSGAPAAPVDFVQDGLMKFAQSKKSFATESAPTTFNASEVNPNRYKAADEFQSYGLSLTGDNEETYGKLQTWGSTLSNAAVGGGKLAWNGFIDGWKGWGRMTDALTSLDWEKLHGDDASMLKLNADMEKTMNDNPIFNTKESDATFFNRKTLGNLFQQTGFTVGTIGQTLLEQGLTKLVEAAIFVPTLGVGSAALESVEDANTGAKLTQMVSALNKTKSLFNVKRAYTDLKKLGDIWKDENVMKNLFKGIGSKIPGVDVALDISKAAEAGASLKQLGYIGISGVKRLASEANMAMTEARMEAAGTYSDMVNKLTADHVAKFGAQPAGQDLDNITSIAGKAASSNFNFNSALLGVMNRIQFDNVFKGYKATSKMGKLFGLGAGKEGSNLLTVAGKMGDKEITQVYRKGAMGTLGVTGKIAADFGKRKAATELGYAVLKSGAKWEVSEGIQELLQEGSNNYFQDLYQNRYNGQGDTSSSSFDKAVHSQLNMQGIKTFMSGALMGMVTSGPMHLLTQAQQNASKGNRAATKARNAATDAHLVELNGAMKDVSTVFSEAIKNFNVQDAVSKQLNSSVKNKNQFAFEDLKATALGQLMATAMRNNTHEGLLDTLKEYGAHFTKEEFEKAFVGADYNSENKGSANDYTNRMITAVQDYAKDWERLQDKFVDRTNPDQFIPGSTEQQEARFIKQATDDMIEILASNRFKAKDTLARMTSIFGKVSAAPGIGGSLASSFNILGSEKHTDSEIFNLREELKGLTANPVKNREINKQIKLKQDQLDALIQWKETKDELLNEIDVDKSHKAFKTFLDSKNDEVDNNIIIQKDEMEDHFLSLTDYVRLNKKNQDFSDAYNTIINPVHFSKLRHKLIRGAKSAAIQIQLDAINTVGRKYGFNIENKESIDKLATLKAKEIWTPEDTKEYYDIIDQLHRNALSYTDATADKYRAKLDDIIDHNAEFRKQNESLIKVMEEAMKELQNGKFSIKPEDQIREELSNAYNTLAAHAYKFLEANPGLMHEAPHVPGAPIVFPPAVVVPPVALNTVIQGIMGNQGLSIMTADLNSKGMFVISGINSATTEQLDKIKNDFEELKKANPTVKYDFSIADNKLVIRVIKNQPPADFVSPELQLKISSLKMDLPLQEFVMAVSALSAANPGNKAFNELLIKKIEGYKIFPAIIDSLKNLILNNVAVSPYVGLSSIIRNETITMTDGDNVSEIYNGGDGKFYDLYTGVEVTIPVTAIVHKNIIDTSGKKIQRNVNTASLESGIELLQNKDLKASLSSNPDLPFTVSGSKVHLANSQKKLTIIQSILPGRTAITHENAGQREKLMKGESILTVKTATDGFTINITIPGNENKVPVFFNDNLVKVNPDNTVEKIDFNNTQTQFLLDNMQVDGRAIRTGELAQMKKAYDNAQKFRAEAELLFANNKQADLTELFKKYFTISTTGVVLSDIEKDDFSKVVNDKANANNLVYAMIGEVNEFGEIIPGSETPFSFPLIQTKINNIWETVDPLEKTNIEPKDPANTIKLIHDGAVISAADFVKNIVGKTIVDEKGQTSHRFIPMSSDQRIYLEQKRGAEPVEGFLNLVSGLMEQVELAKTSTNVNAQMKKFNQGAFTFKPYKGWVADFSLFTHASKPTDIILQLQPKTQGAIDALKAAPKAKRKFNIYIKSNEFKKISKLISENGIAAIMASPELTAEVTAHYRAITDLIAAKMDALEAELRVEVPAEQVEKLVTAGLPDSHLLLEYQMVNGEKVYELKAQDKNKNTAAANNYSVIWSDGNVSNSRALVVTTANRLSSPLVEDNAAEPDILSAKADEPVGDIVTTESVVTGDAPVIINYDPADVIADFSLQGEEIFVPYSDASFQSEKEWMDKNLPSDLKRGALEDIVGQLTAGKPILGYYSNKVMYFSRELSSNGTGYHEAFHGVFKDLMNSERRQFYINKALAEYGDINQAYINMFKNERGVPNKTNAEITAMIAEEYLADGFKKYMLNREEPKQSWFKMFVNMLKKVLDFFTGDRESIRGLYKDISEGKFAHAMLSTQSDNENAFELGMGRPSMRINPKNGQIDAISNVINAKNQEELINRLAHLTSRLSTGKFDDRFEIARLQLIEEYNPEQLIKGVAKENREAAKNKYQNLFYEYQFALGASVPYILEDGVKEKAPSLNPTNPALSTATLALIKRETKARVDSLGIEGGWFDSMDKELLDDEDFETLSKGGEFDKVHINPMIGMSKQFRTLFSLIPYVQKDEETGVKYTRMIDGNAIFNAIMKVAANNPPERVFHAFASTVELMKDEDDENFVRMNTMLKELMRQFGMDEETRNYIPNRNHHLFAQFVDTFFVSEDPSYQLLLNTKGQSSNVTIKDASIQSDIQQVMDKLKIGYEKDFLKTPIADQTKALAEVSRVLVQYFDKSNTGKMNITIGNYAELQKAVKEIKKAFDGIHLNVPKYLITNSLIGIYFVEEKNPITAAMIGRNSVALRHYMGQEQLFKDKCFLQKDFFHQFRIGNIKAGNNLFEKTEKNSSKSSQKDTSINMINGILKKASKMIVKFDINTAVSVFKNPAGESVYRYTRFTPPGLLVQIIRNDGMEGLIKKFPELESWFRDNPLMQDTEENRLFMKNFELAMFGGFKQNLNNSDREGITFGSIDQPTLYLSSILFFMERQVINGKNTSITTFKRSRTQEEATTTNYLVTGLYERMVDKDGKMTDSVVDKLLAHTKQEYNRIAREWAEKDMDKPRFIKYNDTEKGRAYDFRGMENFFKNQKGLAQSMIDSAKAGLSFDDALTTPQTSGTVRDNLDAEFRAYMEAEITDYKDQLVKNNIIKRDAEDKLSSELLPTTLKIDYAKPSLSDENYTLDSLLTDHWLNIFMNKLIVNQIFDGDVAITTKNAVDYYKRNKSGVISGNSMKTGYHRTAIVEELVVYINPKDLSQGQYTSKSDIPAYLNADDFTPNVVFDGQSVHTMNHRMVMYQKWGRNHPDAMVLLKKTRYMELTNDEIKSLADLKIVLNSIKSATGGIITYNKLSEHLLLRTDVSGLVLKQGQRIEDAHNELASLHNQIDVLEGQLLADAAGHPDEINLEAQIEQLYNQIQSYWAPLPSREILHHMLNSMETSGVDQLFDPNASKKGKLVPTPFNPSGITNLKPARQKVDNLFKFMQVETSGVHDKITMPTQARQLISAYLSEESSGKELNDIAKEYSETLGEIAKAATDKVNRILLGDGDSINVNNLYKAMQKDLQSQNADSNTLKILELLEEKDATGKGTNKFKPIHNLNLPFIKKIFTYYYFSFYSKNVFSEKVSGRHDILVSSYGYKVLQDAAGNIIKTEDQKKDVLRYSDKSRYSTRDLGVQRSVVNGVTIYTVEVMIPKPMWENAEYRKLWEEKLSTFFGTRIPTEDKRSMIVAKVVDYLDSSYTNSIVVPQFIHMLAGSDLDVDSLYSHTYDSYTDFNGHPHKYGDYSTHTEHYGSTISQAKFAEYMVYMTKDPAIKELLDEEKTKVEANPVVPAELQNVSEELNLPWLTISKEGMQAQISELKTQKTLLEDDRRKFREIHDMSFETYKQVRQENEAKKARGEKVDWRGQAALSQEFNNAADHAEGVQAQKDQLTKNIQTVKDHIERIDKLVTLIATINILKDKGLPVTQVQLTNYTKDTLKKKGVNPVIPVLQNETLDTKIKILSNEHVFNTMYIKETSEHGVVESVATSIGARVTDLVEAHSIYSIQGDVIANDINSSNKDGISITAAFVKFLSFAVKEKVDLRTAMFHTSDKGKERAHDTFRNENMESIREIGRLLGVFADGAKNPIPSVVNLNTVTASVSETMIGLGISLQSSLLINKVPIIETVTRETQAATSSAQTSVGQYSKKAFSSIAGEYIGDFQDKLKQEKRLSELYMLNKEGYIMTNKMTGLPILQKIIMGEKAPNNQFTNMANNGEVVDVNDLGFVLTYADGRKVSKDVAEFYLLEKWLAVNSLNNDVRKVGSITNLIKKLDPSFESVDIILSNYEYLTDDKSQFKNIDTILTNSTEYQPMLTALRQMERYSQDILIERNKVVYSVDKVIKNGLNAYELFNQKNRESVTDNILKFIIINKFKQETTTELATLRNSTTPADPNRLQNLENAMKFFTADYWINNDFKDDLYYLMDAHKGNPFVEFLKVEARENIEVNESISRMKLDKDITEAIINGYQALQKGSDIKARLIANKLFFHCLVKEGLSYSNNSFIKYIDPSLKEFVKVSKFLNELQVLLKTSTTAINDISRSGFNPKQKVVKIRTEIENIFRGYFSDKNQSLDGFVDNVMNKIGTYVGNKELRVRTKVFNGEKLFGKPLTSEQKKLIEKVLPEIFPVNQEFMQKYRNFIKAEGNSIAESDKVKLDFFTPNDWTPGVGKVVIDMTKITPATEEMSEDLVGQVGVWKEEEGDDYQFPLFVTNKFDQVFELQMLDDERIQSKVQDNIVDYLVDPAASGFKMVGKKAEYLLTANTGTRNIMNSGFTQADGRKLYEHSITVEKPEISEADAMEQGMAGMDEYYSQLEANEAAYAKSQAEPVIPTLVQNVGSMLSQEEMGDLGFKDGKCG